MSGDDVERTEDGRWIVVGGRRWRATDPSIPEPLRQEPADEARRERLTSAVLALARKRSPDKTICPSDAARAVGGEGWRSLMDEARDVARSLARDGQVEVLQRGEPLDPEGEWRGPVRIRARLRG